MIVSIKELIIVTATATLVFWLAKNSALRFSSAADFSRRRNIWFALTTAAFLSPSFWVYVLVAAPLLYWGGRKDSNPIALYVLVFQIIPDIPVDIPTIAIKQLFELDNYRLLSFCVLIPMAWQIRRANGRTKVRSLTAMDYLLFALGILVLLNFVPPDLPGHVLLPDSPTNVLRRGFLFVVDTYVLYYAVSRSCTSREKIVEVMTYFCLAGAIMALVAVYESAHHWLLYNEIIAKWGGREQLTSGYSYMRAGFLRGQASAGHAIALGYFLAVAMGFWLYLRSHLTSRAVRFSGFLALAAGLLSTFSRGAWAGAIVIYFAYVLLAPGTFSRGFKGAALLAILIGALSLTSIGQNIIDSLPFFGSHADDSTLLYRNRLAERSWEIIQQHPLLGDPLAREQMQDLRQGEGIIDLVNTYAETALFYGVIGVGVFTGFILLAMGKTYRLARTLTINDPDAAILGATLVACVAGVLLMLASSSFMLCIPITYYLLGGLATGYADMSKSRELGTLTDARVSRNRSRSSSRFQPAK